jgi:hypothetical protein
VAEKSREAEAAALRRAAQYEQTGNWRFDHEQPALPSAVEGPDLPPLHLVTGWSKACPEPVEGADPKKPKHNPREALFGGWRLADWKRRRGKK